MPACADGRAPVLSGDGSERAMLIGQAPGRHEVELGLPFAGDAGRRLVGWLAAAGIGVEDFRTRWYVTSVGKCYPGRSPGASADRPPSPNELERWRPILDQEVRLVDPRLVVLVGAAAHRHAFGRRPVEALVGQELTWRGADAVCLPHPSGASTWLNDPGHVTLWRAAIDQLRRRWTELELEP